MRRRPHLTEVQQPKSIGKVVNLLALQTAECRRERKLCLQGFFEAIELLPKDLRFVVVQVKLYQALRKHTEENDACTCCSLFALELTANPTPTNLERLELIVDGGSLLYGAISVQRQQIKHEKVRT